VFAAKIDNLGGCWGNSVQALTQWRHPVASSKAWDVLHWAMHPARYHHICMAIKNASNLPAFLLSWISLLATTVANDHVMVHLK
jgi:hypothetical protein